MVLPPPPTVLGPSASSLPVAQLSSIDLMPFSINHDGPAHISTYFHPTPLDSTASTSSSSVVVPLQAAFRGRLLLSTPLALPKGYTGLVFSTTAPAPIQPISIPTTSKGAGKRVRDDATPEPASKASKRRSVVLSAPLGRRRSPRKAVRKMYAMDSDEEEVEAVKDEEEEEQESVAVEMSIEETVAVPASVAPLAAEASLLIPPPEEPAPAPPALGTKEEEKEDNSAVEEATAAPEEEEAELARDVKQLVPIATFSSIQVWNADYAAPLEDDLYAKALGEFVRVADLVHAY